MAQIEASPRSSSRSGAFFAASCLLGTLLFLAPPAAAGPLRGTLRDGRSGQPLSGALVEVRSDTAAQTRRVLSDSSGGFYFERLGAGRWQLSARMLGYEVARRQVEVGAGEVRLEIHLEPRPLLVDEMVVRARRGAGEPTAAFVEVIPVEGQPPGTSLPDLLEGATGVHLRRYGGLGSFSTVSIRGSTAEQVQVYLDGVPLNQALGGGVDLGELPLSGVQSVEVYRGAVPARFGGNSMGGIVSIRTRAADGRPRVRMSAQGGSFGTRRLDATAGGTWEEVKYLGVAQFNESRNDFRFRDDNGTEYNPRDDERTRRRNSDFRSFRALAKAERRLGEGRLHVQNTFDLGHRGIPGIGNFQALHTRFDTWRNLTEVEFSGTWAAAGGSAYRLRAYHLLERDEYKDLRGEVGTGMQHERNTTRSFGLRGEFTARLPGRSLLSFFGGGRRESFAPRDLFRGRSDLLASRRRSASFGVEIEKPLWGRLQGLGGSQVEIIQDRFFDQKDFGATRLLPSRDNLEVLWGQRLGGRLRLGRGWSVQGHRGRYRRAPGFFELFGDRGAVLGNTDLRSERGDNWDAGVVFHPAKPGRTGLLFLETVYYRNRAHDLIRFIQNSQRVSQPHNIGTALLQGVELRGRAQWSTLVQLSGNYAYQRAENRAPFSFERGRDLPNAPRHTLHLSAVFGRRNYSLRYDLSRESRHFMDRANLRAIPTRTLHNLGGHFRLAPGVELAWEIRNLSANQVADLWGFPLPGRSYFLSFNQDLHGGG